jgi:hypothetical protein
MHATRIPTIRAFWAEVLAKARTEELVEITETLAARRGSEGSEADSDLLVLARQILEQRRTLQ